MDMQRTGSRPIGVIIAVVVIALCAYGAIQLASNQPEEAAPANTPVVNEPTPTPAANPSPNNPSNVSGPSPRPGTFDSEAGETPRSSPDVASNDRSANGDDVSGREAGSESEEDGTLPSTGPAILEIIPLAALIVILGAYRKSRRQLSAVFLER
jgi:hypothetical protein